MRLVWKIELGLTLEIWCSIPKKHGKLLKFLSRVGYAYSMGQVIKAGPVPLKVES